VDPDSTRTSDGSTQSAGSSVPTGAPRDFGEYVLLGELGRGGMGVVYEARQTRLDRIVALKLILAGSWASPIQIERFRLEARAAASLAHPNIVKIFDAGECYGQPYIAMEFIRGRSLAAVLRRGPPRIRDAIAPSRAGGWPTAIPKDNVLPLSILLTACSGLVSFSSYRLRAFAMGLRLLFRDRLYRPEDRTGHPLEKNSWSSRLKSQNASCIILQVTGIRRFHDTCFWLPFLQNYRTRSM
jgi:serine/threonine protein kinase